MGKPKTTGMRKMQARKQDYECYINCVYKTHYSFEVGQQSKESNLCTKLPTYAQFLSWVQSQQKHYFDFVYESEEGLVVAYAEVSFFLNRQILEIANLIVDRNYQQQGYGSKFYNELESYAKDMGIKKIFLSPKGDGAKIFWRKMGFSGKKAYVKCL